MSLFIDAVIVKGAGNKKFGCQINQKDEIGSNFSPMNLSNYNIRFRVLGSPTADADVLVEHIISTNSNEEVDGSITNPEEGQFTFTINLEDQKKLSLGKHPITIEFLDAQSQEYLFTLTEGNTRQEFNCIQLVQV